MKLRLIINRFVEVDSIDVPINYTTTFDASGVTQLKNTFSQIEASFKKTMSTPTYSATMKDYFNTTPLEKYKDTLSGMKDSIRESMRDYKPTETVGEVFSKNTPSILEMNNAYKTVLDKFKESTPIIKSIGDSVKESFKADYTSDLSTQVKEAYTSYKYLNSELDKTDSRSKKAGNGLKKLATIVRSSVLIQIQILARTVRRLFSFLE